jgi:hypothetical protein
MAAYAKAQRMFAHACIKFSLKQARLRDTMEVSISVCFRRGIHMKILSDAELLEVLIKAKLFQLSEDFIQLIVSEAERRKLALPETDPVALPDDLRHVAV